MTDAVDEQPITTLGDFIEDQMAKRRLSARAFADLLEVNNRMINEYRQHGKNPSIGNPRHDFLLKLAHKTNTNPVIIFSLTFGLADALKKLQNISPTALARAQQIEELPPDIRNIVDGILIAHSQKRQNDTDRS